MRKVSIKIDTPRYLVQSLQWLLVCGLGLIMGLVIIASRPNIWFVFLLTGLTLIILINHKIGIILLFISIFLIDWISQFVGLLPRQFTWFTDIILILLLAKVILIKLFDKSFQKTSIDKWFLILACLALIGSLVNEMNPIVSVLGFRNFFKYIVMFYVLVNINLEEKFLKNMLRLLIFIALVQIPVTIVEWRIYGTGDNVVGTLGSHTTGIMAIFLAFTASFMIGFYLHTGKILYLVTIVLLFIPIILGSGRFGFLLIPAAVIFSVLFGGKISIKKVIKSTLLSFIVFVTMFCAVKIHDKIVDRGDFYELLISPERMYLYTTGYAKGGKLNRTEAIIFAANLISQSPVKFLLGYGPGNASPSYFSNFEGALETQYKGLRVRGVQLSWVMLEFGILGLLFFLLIYFYLFRENQTFYFQTQDSFWKSISIGYNGIIFAYLVSIVYTSVWVSDVTAFSFWLISASIIAMKTKRIN